MGIFITNITSFPVIVFTFLLTIVLCYWLMALLGVVDIEMLDVDMDMDVTTDFETEVSIDPNAEGIGGIAGFMLIWGLTGVPVTVVLSLLIVTSWIICYVIVSLLFPLIPLGIIKHIIGVCLLLASFAISIPITAFFIKPFKSFFVTHNAVKKDSLIGQECQVKTGKVTATFGQGILEDGQAGMILDIRADESLGIKKGDSVILIEYNEDDDSYNVAKI